MSHSKTRLVLQLGEEGRSRVVQTQYLLVLELAKKGTPGTHPPPKSATDAHSKEFRPKMLCAQPWYVLNHQFEIQFFFFRIHVRWQYHTIPPNLSPPIVLIKNIVWGQTDNFNDHQYSSYTVLLHDVMWVLRTSKYRPYKYTHTCQYFCAKKHEEAML